MTIAGVFATLSLMTAPIDNPVQPQTQVAQGVLQGRSEEGVASYRNIPYAAPPVGPQPARLDLRGDRLLFAGGAQAWSIDTITGAAVALSGSYRATALAPDGNHALVGATHGTNLVDARTGTVIASTPALGFELGVVFAPVVSSVPRGAAGSRAGKPNVKRILVAPLGPLEERLGGLGLLGGHSGSLAR
jgi:hypothetical protein